MKKHSWLVGLSLLGLLYTQAAAEQLYIRNRPFKGTVKRSDGRVWVDLKTFAEALGATVEQDSEGKTVVKMPGAADQALTETQDDSGITLVPLEATAKSLGARVITNKQMGTIDVSLAPSAAQAPAATVAVAKPAESGPIIRNINRNGSNVDVTTQLVPGRTNIVDFGAEW